MPDCKAATGGLDNPGGRFLLQGCQVELGIGLSAPTLRFRHAVLVPLEQQNEPVLILLNLLEPPDHVLSLGDLVHAVAGLLAGEVQGLVEGKLVDGQVSLAPPAESLAFALSALVPANCSFLLLEAWSSALLDWHLCFELVGVGGP